MACGPEEEPASAWHGDTTCQRRSELLAPTSRVCRLKMVPTGFVVPAPFGIPEELSARGTVLSVTCVPVGPWRGRAGVGDRQQLSEHLTLLTMSVRSARPGMHLERVLISVPKTISEEYGSGRCYLRGLSREMQHMAAGPGELCSPCEPCSCEEL